MLLERESLTAQTSINVTREDACYLCAVVSIAAIAYFAVKVSSAAGDAKIRLIAFNCGRRRRHIGVDATQTRDVGLRWGVGSLSILVEKKPNIDVEWRSPLRVVPCVPICLLLIVEGTSPIAPSSLSPTSLAEGVVGLSDGCTEFLVLADVIPAVAAKRMLMKSSLAMVTALHACLVGAVVHALGAKRHPALVWQVICFSGLNMAPTIASFCHGAAARRLDILFFSCLWLALLLLSIRAALGLKCDAGQIFETPKCTKRLYQVVFVLIAIHASLFGFTQLRRGLDRFHETNEEQIAHARVAAYLQNSVIAHNLMLHHAVLLGCGFAGLQIIHTPGRSWRGGHACLNFYRLGAPPLYVLRALEAFNQDRVAAFWDIATAISCVLAVVVSFMAKLWTLQDIETTDSTMRAPEESERVSLLRQLSRMPNLHGWMTGRCVGFPVFVSWAYMAALVLQAAMWQLECVVMLALHVVGSCGSDFRGISAMFAAVMNFSIHGAYIFVTFEHSAFEDSAAQRKRCMGRLTIYAPFQILIAGISLIQFFSLWAESSQTSHLATAYVSIQALALTRVMLALTLCAALPLALALPCCDLATSLNTDGNSNAWKNSVAAVYSETQHLTNVSRHDRKDDAVECAVLGCVQEGSDLHTLVPVADALSRKALGGSTDDVCRIQHWQEGKDFAKAHHWAFVLAAVSTIVSVVLATWPSVTNSAHARVSFGHAGTGELYFFHFVMMGCGGALVALDLPYHYGLMVAQRCAGISAFISFLVFIWLVTKRRMALVAMVAPFSLASSIVFRTLGLAAIRMRSAGIRSRSAILGPSEASWKAPEQFASSELQHVPESL